MGSLKACLQPFGTSYDEDFKCDSVAGKLTLTVFHELAKCSEYKDFFSCIGCKKKLYSPRSFNTRLLNPEGSKSPGSRAAPKPHFISQDLVKNTSLEGGLPVLQIQIPFRIHLLGS